MSSGKLGERDLQVLRHLARYRLAFKEILSLLFFEGRDPQKALDRLRQEGYLKARKGLTKNRSTYHPTSKAVRLLGSKARRSDSLGPESLPTHLAVYNFCFLGGKPRLRLEKDELATLFDDAPPSGRFHCVERSSGTVLLHHVYVPGPSTRPTDITDRTRDHWKHVSRSRELRRWLRYRVYGHTILVDTPDRKAAVQAALCDAKSEDDATLQQAANCHVELVAGPHNLEDALRVLA